MDYNALSSKANSLVTKFGCTATLGIFSPGTYNPIIGSYTQITYTNHTINMVLLGVSGSAGRQGLSSDEVKLILEEKIDKIGIIAAEDLAVTPTTKDRILKGSDIYEILYVNSVTPATTTLIYKVWLRKGA